MYKRQLLTLNYTVFVSVVTYKASKAYAKISMRLVSNQDWKKISRLFTEHMQNITPKGMSIKINEHHGGQPYLTSTDSKAYSAASKAYMSVFNKEPFAVKDGGSIPIIAQFEKELGPVVIRHFEDLSKESVLFTTYLQPAERSSLISQQTRSSALNTTIEYLVLGIEHIVPKGLDHILFIIGIFFYAIKFKPLLLQVTMFTVAHSITLILASFNLIFIPATIVEPLIALSISYVAIENIFQRRSTLLRYLIIFIFGLIHGLGFAFVLGDIGLNTSQLVLSLISFNIGCLLYTSPSPRD